MSLNQKLNKKLQFLMDKITIWEDKGTYIDLYVENKGGAHWEPKYIILPPMYKMLNDSEFFSVSIEGHGNDTRLRVKAK
jgi:hypothetical protein